MLTETTFLAQCPQTVRNLGVYTYVAPNKDEFMCGLMKYR